MREVSVSLLNKNIEKETPKKKYGVSATDNEHRLMSIKNEIDSKLEYIDNITISNFRGFGIKKTKIEFATPTDNKSGLNIVVGENCSGKSTILEAINLLLTQNTNINNGLHTSMSMYNNINKAINIVATFNNGKMKVESNNRNTVIKRTSSFQYPTNENHILHIPSRKNVNSNVLQNDPGSLTNFIINQGLGNGDRLNRRNSNQNNDFLSILMRIDKEDEERIKFDEIFHKFLPNITWNVRLSDESNYGYIVRFKDEIGESMFEGVGDGLITILYIAIGIYALEVQKNIKVLTIDEPEVSLHPQLIRKITDILEEYAKKHQIFISTHSPHLINWAAVKEGAKLIRTIKDNNKIRIYCLDNSIFQNDNSCISTSHPHTFGLNANEVFFLRDKVILVEGQDDVICFRYIIEKIGKNIFDYYFYGWGSNGASNMETIAKVLNSLGYKKIVMILDGDSIGKKSAKNYSKQFENYLIKNISTEDIRDKKEIKQNIIVNKIGICNKNFKIKKDFDSKYKKEMIKLFNDITEYFNN